MEGTQTSGLELGLSLRDDALWLQHGVSAAGLCCLIHGVSTRAAECGDRQWEGVSSVSQRDNAYFLSTNPESRRFDTIKTHFSTRSDVSWAIFSIL